MFKHVKSKHRLGNAILKQVEKQRNGEVIETSLVKKVIDSLGEKNLLPMYAFEWNTDTITTSVVSLGLDESDSTKQNLEVYRADFESIFLQATELYYKAESDTFVTENSVVDYMKKAETRLKEEEDRIELYLHPSTRPKVCRKKEREREREAVLLKYADLTISLCLQLIGTCETVLVRGHSQLLWDEFQALLDADKAVGKY